MHEESFADRDDYVLVDILDLPSGHGACQFDCCFPGLPDQATVAARYRTEPGSPVAQTSIPPLSQAAAIARDGDSQPTRVPTYDRLFRPVLEVVADGRPWSAGDVAAAVADLVGIDDASRELRHPSGQTVLFNRIGWAKTFLVKAGLVEQPGPASIAITDSGRAVLESAEGPIDREFLRRNCPGFATWLADLGQLPDEELDSSAETTVWMLRAGRGGTYAPVFVERSLAVVGWGQTGDVSTLSREQLETLVTECLADASRNQRGQAVNTLYRVVHTIADGDLIVTPEPAARTLLLGHVAGPYCYLEEPVGGEYQHARPVRWFARVARDELSYGARNSLGSLLTLTRPSYATELLQLAEAHTADPPPSPLVPHSRGQAAGPLVAQRVPVPANASVPERASVSEFQTNPRLMLQLLDELDNGQLALPDFQRSFVWAPDATRELIVSIIRSFPAGALLFLQGGGSIFKPREVEEAPALTSVKPSYLVLDGQQRLTSLYQAMRGVGQSRFFLDIGALIAGSEVNDAVRVFSTERAAPLEPLQAQADAMMMPLSAVRNGGSARWRDEVVRIRNEEDPDRLRELLYGVDDAYIHPLEQYRFPVTILPETTELEAVCTIFETLNRTGKPLTPFELISARAFTGGLSLYDYWAAARDEHPILEDFEIEPYYLLQAIALRLGRSCKRSSVLSMGVDDIVLHWNAAVADMAAAILLLRDECGVLISKWLPYRPMLIPLAAAWRQVAEAAGPDQGAMRAKLKRWFWCACFMGEYESSSATLAERDAPVLKGWLSGGDEPPVLREFAWEPARWRSVTIRQQGLYRATIALTLTQRPRDFHTAAPLTQEVIEAGKVDDHHVFPRGFLKDIKRGGEVDSVLNHALIDRATNTSIGMKAPSVYLKEIREALGRDLDTVLESHRLPAGDDSPLARDDFDGFLAWRIEHFAEALAERAGAIAPPAPFMAPHLAKLNARIENVELALRELILSRLDNDPTRLPPQMAQKARERIDTAARKEPGTGALEVSDLDAFLEYLDLRDLQEILTAKPTWPLFVSIFGTKEGLASRFSQLADLRNAIRHSRSVSDVAIKDGEAAVLWFGQVFDSLDRDATDGEE
jgi:hypothetical protein